MGPVMLQATNHHSHSHHHAASSSSGASGASGGASGPGSGLAMMTIGGSPAASSADHRILGGERLGDNSQGGRGDNRDGRDADNSTGHHEAPAQGGGGGPPQPQHGSSRLSAGRRFIMGERVVLASRLPGYTQDHAFCFECGAFFQLTNARQPQCSRCGSSFVQFLRGAAGNATWVGSESSAGVQFTFDNQLETTLTTSMDETPMTKRPTQESFVRSLPAVVVSDADMQLRHKLDPSDPRCYCAVCRDGYSIGDRMRRLPCNHSFHEDCIMPWLQQNNTCPTCRCKMPEKAADGEDEAEEDAELLRLKHTRSAPEVLQNGGQGGGDHPRGEGPSAPRFSAASHGSRHSAGGMPSEGRPRSAAPGSSAMSPPPSASS